MVCQLVGKPNKKIPPAFLYPISMVAPPFDHVIVVIVDPLVSFSSGYFNNFVCCGFTNALLHTLVVTNGYFSQKPSGTNSHATLKIA